MILTEKHYIKKNGNRELYAKYDMYCYKAKNLRNAVNYIIKQCSHIHYKLKNGEILESFEKQIIKNVNDFIYKHNKGLKFIDESNGFIANAYFLSTYLKDSKEYKEMPYSTCSQKIIEQLCKDWKGFYESTKSYKKNSSNFLGKPKVPNYYDKDKGRCWLTITYQNFKQDEKGIVILLQYEILESEKTKDNGRYIGIDIGVNNLMSVTSNTEMLPFIINGKPLKSINQYYNKRVSHLRSIATTCNGRNVTKRIRRITEKRNRKVDDYLHKATKYLIELAKHNNICEIVIGLNKGWKQEVNLDKMKRVQSSTQNFVNIPYERMIEMLKYKGKLFGIEVTVVDESYTSGTSYIDGELPIKENYNKKRRKSRGIFESNGGIRINADINASYQIMKKAKKRVEYKGFEVVKRINVA